MIGSSGLLGSRLSEGLIDSALVSTPPSRMGLMTRERKFEAVVTAYGRTLYRYAFWLSKDANAAEDLVQEALLKAWRALDQLQNEKAALSWLMTILRREHYRIVASIEVRNTLPMESVAKLASPSTVRIDELSVRSAIRELPAQLREPLVLRLLDDLSVVEISEIMGVSAASVTMRLFRARQAIRRRLLEGGASANLNRELGT